MNISKETFEEKVRQKIKEKNISYILAVYQTYEEFYEKESEEIKVKFVCKKGCCNCCYQLIACTEMEIDEIKKYVDKLPKKIRRPIIVRLKKSAKKWLKYYEENKNLIEKNPLKQYENWEGKPCPFLDVINGFCSIYPVRSIDCRTLRSDTICKSKKSPGERVKRFCYKSDIIANNLILEKQFAVTPIYHWLPIKWDLKIGDK